MTVENEKLAAILYARGLNPEIMQVARVYFPDGWRNIVIYDEGAVNEAIASLNSVLGESEPEFVQDMLDEMRAFHHNRRRQQGMTMEVPNVGD